MKRTYSIPNTDVVGIATVLSLALSLTKEDEGDDYEVSDEELLLSAKTIKPYLDFVFLGQPMCHTYSSFILT